jgi:uncharacterized protein YbaP (TraB family)
MPGPPPTGEKHSLWRITNARAPFYLLGSIHSLRSADYAFPQAISQAIQQSQQFWFEIDPNRPDLFTKKVSAAARYPKGTHIKDKINPKTYDCMLKVSHGRTAGVWQDLKPWAIALFLLSHPAFSGVSYEYGVDHHVFEKAKLRGRPCGGIETIDEHIRVFNDMTDIESEIVLLQALVYMDEDAKGQRDLVSAWRKGDVDRLYDIEVPKIKEAPTVWWRLLDRRNANWIPKIETEIKTGIPTMIVVGALHYPGPHGLLAMLHARGYKIEQL